MDVSTHSGRNTPGRQDIVSLTGRSADLTTTILWILIAVAALLLHFRSQIAQMPLSFVCIVASVIFLLALLAGYILSGRNFWSYSFVYLMVLGVFHFGLIVPYAIGVVDHDDISQAQLWWERSATPEAIVVTCLGYVGCCIGIAFIRWIGRIQQSRNSRQLAHTSSRTIGLAGAAMLAISVGAWFTYTISSGGLWIFFSSYENYLARTAGRGGVYAFFWFFIGLGLCLSFVSPKSRLWMISLAVFGGFAVFALPLGLRGEVLFPVAAATPILAHRHKMPSPRAAIIGIFIVLFIVSLLKDVRAVGLNDLADGQVAPSVVSGLVELGSSLRPVTEVVLWQDLGNERLNGASYWAPIDRAICSFAEPETCIAVSEDKRIVAEVIVGRAGPIGFSPIAEALANFGPGGALGVMILVGGVVACLDNWAVNWKREALASVLYVELLVNIRNSFLALPSHIILGCGVVIALAVFANSVKSSRSQLGLHQHSDPLNSTQVQ